MAGEHESSRRLKTEILTQMEGVDAATADRRVVLVAATNRPEVGCTIHVIYMCDMWSPSLLCAENYMRHPN